MAELSLNRLKSKNFSWSDPDLKIAILGFGAEGSSTYQYLTDQGVKKSQIIIYDASSETKLKLQLTQNL